MGRGNYAGLRKELAQVEWAPIIEGRTVEEQWRMFREVLNTSQLKYIPERKWNCKRKKNIPWLDKEVQEDIKASPRGYQTAKASAKLED